MLILPGDCLVSMRCLPSDSVDAVITDPPYGIRFMGAKWDYDVPSTEVWAECLRVLKPGGHLLAFAGTRTQHRMACRIEDAGFEIRDMIAWVYGSGFPKSHNLADDWQGWGTALKPALEPITVARKPFKDTVAANVQARGTGAINIDGCRVDANGDPQLVEKYASVQNSGARANAIYGADTRDRAGAEPHPQGRWPANLVHDGSEEVVGLFPDSKGSGSSRVLKRGTREGENWGLADQPGQLRDAGAGSAARFFYCAKASKADRGEGNDWPTVKPIELMRWLCRLVTPPGGVILDPFTGSGSTGVAAIREGFGFIGCERDPKALAIADSRLSKEV